MLSTLILCFFENSVYSVSSSCLFFSGAHQLKVSKPDLHKTAFNKNSSVTGWQVFICYMLAGIFRASQ